MSDVSTRNGSTTSPPAWRSEYVGGWGMAVGGQANVARPDTRAQLEAAFAELPAGASVALRGTGCSYGDASMHTGRHVLDCTRLTGILAFDVEHGVVTVEPGVTIRQLWRHVIPHGWWPPVVSGTMFVTIGGATAMNIHGKNNFAVGSFGEHVLAFTLLTPTGAILSCSRETNADVFHAAIGGFGMLGCFLDVTLKLKRVHSGRLRVTAIATRDLEDNLWVLEEHRGSADYLVGWMDGYARGRSLGRGLIHRADQFERGEDPAGEGMLDPLRQDVPSRLFGVVPKGWVWPFAWGIVKSGALSLLNAAKFHAGCREETRMPYLQTHGAFHFLLDYVPNWKFAFKPGGLIQFQPFVPAPEAARVLRVLLEQCQAERFFPYLLVLKRHRPDPFLMTHAVDGYSLAIEFAVRASRRDELFAHCRRMADVVLDAGGRFYYAKDAVLAASSFPRVHGADAVAQFRGLKARLDPNGVLQTDLARRLGVVPDDARAVGATSAGALRI
jgi:decaprenylphospho-beta-D-ribofuranose 2-oxidase